MSDGNGDLFTIGALSKASGATPRAIRFYEGLGLVSSYQRSRGGYRLFRQVELSKLSLVTGMRKSGFPIKDIVRLFSIADRSRTAADAARSINEALLDGAAEVKEIVETLRLLAADLTRSADVLARCLDCNRSFDELNCGECEPFSDLSKEGYPMAVRALWPLKYD